MADYTSRFYSIQEVFDGYQIALKYGGEHMNTGYVSVRTSEIFRVSCYDTMIKAETKMLSDGLIKRDVGYVDQMI